MATAPMLESVRRAVSESRPDAVVLDVDRVGFMDSAGLKAILEARDRLAAGGRTLQLLNSPPVVQRLFELADAQA